jgi:hypothetical protein
MNCQICGKQASENSVVCSDECQNIRLAIFELINEVTPTNGCDNCWGDLHQGCTEQCKGEFERLSEFSEKLWSLVKQFL